MRSFVPEGQSGDWKVEKFIVSEADARFHNLRCAINACIRQIEPGIYTKLVRGGTLVMSDTPAELQDSKYFVAIAKGKVLLNGLGLGCVLQALLEKSEVTGIVVNEISADVIKLVGPYFKDKRVTINYTDALTWKPPKAARFDFVWHDIWDNICGDNWETMKRLHRRYGHWAQKQMSWCRSEVMNEQR